MRVRAIVLLILSVAIFESAAAETTSTSIEKWVSLFDGKTLNGWTPKIKGYDAGDNYENTFRVEDGLLKVRYNKPEFEGKFGHLFYKDKLSHYRLRIEYRFVGEQAKDGPKWALRNSGVMLHCQSPQSMGKDQDFPVSLECQFLGGDGKSERSTANLCTPGTTVLLDGKPQPGHCTTSRSATYPLETWVTVEVEVHGGELIRHIVDGKPVMEYEKPQLDAADANAKPLIVNGNTALSEGYIALQSESHPIDFRKVELLTLPH
jgi:hypothetical protein